jgi:ribose transport system permease protein
VLRYGVYAVFVVMVAVFCILRPAEFAQLSTIRSVLDDAAVLAVIAAGLTVVLAVNEFDLSLGNLAGLAGAVGIYCMATLGVGTALAVLAGLAVGVAGGLLNGLLVAYGRVPALIGTLAVGSLAIGIERALMQDNTIYEGITPGFLSFTQGEFLFLPSSVWVSLLAVAAAALLMSFGVAGRRIYAVGGNEEAARIAGVRTQRTRVLAFVILGLCVGLAGLLLMSRSASYYPNAGLPLLLPAYAACFLGWSASPRGRFHPGYTYFGVIFMGTLSTGLVMLQVASWITDVLQGLVLAGAVLIASIVRRAA